MVKYFISVDLANGRSTETILTDEKTVTLAVKRALGASLEFNDYYILFQGRLVHKEDEIVDGGWYHAVPRLVGGKGGFGSMLRALGAQIEKTTNREACRDLSGRRMRDVNNEKKLREWAAKSAEREKDKQERRKEKRERALAPKKFKEEDKAYEMQRQKIADDLDDAFQQGIRKSKPSASSSACSSSFTSDVACATSLKRKSPPTATEVDPKKAKPWIHMGEEEEDSSSNDDSEPSKESLTETTERATDNGIDNAAANEMNRRPNELPDDKRENAPEKLDDKEVQDDPVEDVSIDPVQLGQSLDLNLYDSADALAQLGLEVLKAALVARGMKCGGSLKERAERLYSVKALQPDQIPSNLLAKPMKKK